MGIPFTCPHCSHPTNVPEQYAGQTGPCASCGQAVTIPGVVTPWVCPQCSTNLPAGTGTCTNCGLAFHQPLSPGQRKHDIGDDAGMRMLVPVGRSPLAIVAGYLGLISVLVLPAPFALLFGILAIRDIKKHPEKHGMGRAIFGIVMGGLGSVVLPFVLIAIASNF